MQLHSTHSDEETRKLGKDLARRLKPGDVVLLYGDLGYGKTTFVKGVAAGLGITSRIISPTYVIIKNYKIGNKISNVLYHIDLYRLENKKQLDEVGLEDILQDESSIKLIEWPEKMSVGKIKRWEVRFQMNTDNTRTIKIHEYR